MASFETFSTEEVESSTQLGELQLAQVQSAPATVTHARAEAARARDPTFFLLLQLEGGSLNRQDEREARLTPGDFTLCATERPYEMSFPGTSRRLVIGIPDDRMRRHLACPDSLVAVRMSGNRGVAALVSSFLRSLWRSREDIIEPTIALRISYTVLDLVAAAYSSAPHARCEQSSLVAAHRVRIVSYIEAHLRDPALCPASVAQACRITPRYLHHLFTRESETVTQYIQRRRLEECARALVEAPMRTRLVTEIAFDHGFNSLTHFGRLFRSQYGLTPSEYRRALKN